MKRWLTGASLLIASIAAAACPLCGDSQGYTSSRALVDRQRAAAASLGNGSTPPDVIEVIRDEVPKARAVHRLDSGAAASAVLALPGDRGKRLKVIEVIRGQMPAGGTIEPAWVDGLDCGIVSTVKQLLLIRATNWQSWANPGPIGVGHALWLRQLAATKPTTDITEADFAFVLPYLENDEPIVAEIAYGELARAPYSALRSLKGHADARALRQWAADLSSQGGNRCTRCC